MRWSTDALLRDTLIAVPDEHAVFGMFDEASDCIYVGMTPQGKGLRTRLEEVLLQRSSSPRQAVTIDPDLVMHVRWWLHSGDPIEREALDLAAFTTLKPGFAIRPEASEIAREIIALPGASLELKRRLRAPDGVWNRPTWERALESLAARVERLENLLRRRMPGAARALGENTDPVLGSIHGLDPTRDAYGEGEFEEDEDPTDP